MPEPERTTEGILYVGGPWCGKRRSEPGAHPVYLARRGLHLVPCDIPPPPVGGWALVGFYELRTNASLLAPCVRLWDGQRPTKPNLGRPVWRWTQLYGDIAHPIPTDDIGEQAA